MEQKSNESPKMDSKKKTNLNLKDKESNLIYALVPDISERQDKPGSSNVIFSSSPINVPISQPLYSPQGYSKLSKFSDVVHQIGYYFGEENLLKDKFIKRNMDRNGFVSADLIVAFPRMSNNGISKELILKAAKVNPKIDVVGDFIRSVLWWKHVTPALAEKPAKTEENSRPESLKMSDFEKIKKNDKETVKNNHFKDFELNNNRNRETVFLNEQVPPPSRNYFRNRTNGVGVNRYQNNPRIQPFVPQRYAFPVNSPLQYQSPEFYPNVNSQRMVYGSQMTQNVNYKYSQRMPFVSQMPQNVNYDYSQRMPFVQGRGRGKGYYRRSNRRGRGRNQKGKFGRMERKVEGENFSKEMGAKELGNKEVGNGIGDEAIVEEVKNQLRRTVISASEKEGSKGNVADPQTS